MQGVSKKIMVVTAQKVQMLSFRVLARGLPSILLLAREETGLARFPDWSLAEGIWDLISFEACVFFLRRYVTFNWRISSVWVDHSLEWSIITYHLHFPLDPTRRQMKVCPIRQVKLWFRNGPRKAMWISAVPWRLDIKNESINQQPIEVVGPGGDF